MRVIFALLYIALGIWIYLKLGGETLHPYIGMAVGLGLILSSVVVCNEGFIRKLRGVSHEQHIETLILNQKAIVENYQVNNSIVFDDISTGCTAYLLDIGSNKILCLYGQDYGFEPINDDPEFNQERLFPTESFSLIRELKKQSVLEVSPKGKVLKPSIIDEPNIKELLNLGFKLEDGEVVNDISFAQILEALA